MKQINQGKKTVIDSSIHVMKSESETWQKAETNIEATKILLNATHCCLCEKEYWETPGWKNLCQEI